MNRVTKLMIGLGLALAGGACTNTDSATNLVPEGPPMIRQVRLNHKVKNADGSDSTFRVFAFGSHELAKPEELKSGQVTTASAVNNSFRIIIDELLVGNNLEEIACRAQVNVDGVFARVPIGATPDDIAACSAPDDALPRSCKGPTAVCLCELEGGCAGTSAQIAFGDPVGVLDVNQDGATDDTQFIGGYDAGGVPASIGLSCDGINIPVDVTKSYWNPSGDQNKPAMGGFDALGPAIVLTPGDGNAATGHGASMPTGTTCKLTANPNIVDKQGIQLCTPPNGGEVINGTYVADCTPGNLDEFTFGVEPLNVGPVSFANGQTGVNRSGNITLTSNAPLSATAFATGTVTLKEKVSGTPYTAFAVTKGTTAQVIILDLNKDGAGNVITPLKATTEYELTITTSIKDTYDKPLSAERTATFTTGS